MLLLRAESLPRRFPFDVGPKAPGKGSSAHILVHVEKVQSRITTQVLAAYRDGHRGGFCESASMLLLICPDKHALHESRVEVEVVRRGLSGLCIRPRPTHTEIRLAR
jgi:hypothetical protein